MKDLKLDSIFTPISERVKTPFYSVFVIYWLVFNWEIIYVTLFFKKSDFHGFDIVNYLKHVGYINLWDNFIYPFIFTIIYILAYPILDKCLFKYLEKRKRQKVEEKIKIGRKFSVSGEKYWDLNKELESTLKVFSSISEENLIHKTKLSENEIEIVKLQNLIADQKRNLETNNNDLETLRNRNDPGKLFNDPWQIKIADGSYLGPFKNDEYYEFRNNNQIIKYMDQTPVAKVLFFEMDFRYNRFKLLVSEEKASHLLTFFDLHRDTSILFSGTVDARRVTIEKKNSLKDTDS